MAEQDMQRDTGDALQASALQSPRKDLESSPQIESSLALSSPVSTGTILSAHQFERLQNIAQIVERRDGNLTPLDRRVVLEIVDEIRLDTGLMTKLQLENNSREHVAFSIATGLLTSPENASIARILVQSMSSELGLESDFAAVRQEASQSKDRALSRRSHGTEAERAPQTESSPSVSSMVVDTVTSASTWSFVGSLLWSGVKSAASYAVRVVTEPETFMEAASAVGHFAYGVAETMGVIEMAKGVAKFAEGIGRLAVAPYRMVASVATHGFKLATGQESLSEAFNGCVKDASSIAGEIGQCFLESTRAVKGAIMAVGEVTGISDACRAVYYLAKGDYASAALYGTIAAVSIGAFVWSGGLSSIGVAAAKVGLAQTVKGVLTKAAAEGVEAIGKEIAQETLEVVSKNLGEAALNETGAAVTESAAKTMGEKALAQAISQTTDVVLSRGVGELAEVVSKEGAEALVGAQAKGIVHDIFEKHGYEAVKNLVSDLKIAQHVKDLTLKELKNFDSSSVKELTQHLKNLGVSPEQAKSAAKELRRLIKKGGADEELIEKLTITITDDISQQILKRMEPQFKEGLEAALRGEIPSGASKQFSESITQLQAAMQKHEITLTKQQIDDLVEAGWDGCSKGVRKAVREAVERGVRDAFDEFRNSRFRARSSMAFGVAVTDALTVSGPDFNPVNNDVIPVTLATPKERLGNGDDDAGKMRRRQTRKNTVYDQETVTEDEETVGA
jgi:hypothetical protein